MKPALSTPKVLRFSIVRTRLLILHITVIAALLSLAGLSFFRLIAFSPDPIGAAALLGLSCTLIILPVFLYRLILLIRSHYDISPSGTLTIAFGPHLEILALDEIEEIRSGAGIPDSVRSVAPGWRNAWQGRTETKDERPVDWYATEFGPHLLLIVTKDRFLCVAPANPIQFAQTLTEISSQGSLEKVRTVSIQSPNLFSEILSNRAAFALLSGSLALILVLGSVLFGLQPALPENQIFKFDPSGIPTSPGDPARLLLLPFAGGLGWILNSILGWLAWRRGDRSAAYTLWIVSLVMAIGLWFAVLTLLRFK